MRDLPKGTPVVEFKTPDNTTVMDDLRTLEASLQTNHLQHQRHIILGPEQFKFIMQALMRGEELEKDVEKAKTYWQEWAAKEIRKVVKAGEQGTLIEALEDIRDNYDHEDQTHDHQPFKYGGNCRVCTATKALEDVGA